MPRVLIATIGGVLGLALYIMLAAAAADHVEPVHWAVKLFYFVIAGTLWVFPVRWLMLWAARMR